MNLSKSLIHGYWLTANHLVHNLTDNDDVKSGIALQLKKYTHLDEKTRHDAVARFDESSDSFMEKIQHLIDAIFDLHQGLPVIRFDQCSQDLCRIVCPDSLLCLHENLSRYDDCLNWGAYSFRDGHGSNSVLNNGSIDTHIHLGGVLPPLFYWLILMSGQQPINGVRGLESGNGNKPSKQQLQTAITKAMRLRLKLAHKVQQKSMDRAFPHLAHADWDTLELDDDKPQCFAQVRDNLAAFSAPHRLLFAGNERDAMFWDVLREHPNQHYASGERRLLLHAGAVLRGQGQDNNIEECLLNYLRVKNAFHQLLLHEHGSDGLMRFLDNLSRRGFAFDFGRRGHRQKRLMLNLERIRMKTALDMQLKEAFWTAKSTDYQCEYDKPVRKIEMRVTLPENQGCLRTIFAWLQGISDHVSTGANGEQLESGFNRSQVGLVFHLIKSPYKKDEHLAELAKHSARKLIYLLQDYPKLRAFVVGFDVAGAERGTSPRIYLEAFNTLRTEQEKFRPNKQQLPLRLGWTYHVGEDYVDLLTALRHLDEVSTLLFADDGGRLGHALALGDAPERYYQRGNRWIEINLGTHLLDLVWAYGKLTELSELVLVNYLKNYVRQFGNTLSEENMVSCYRTMLIKPHKKKHDNELLESSLLTDLNFQTKHDKSIRIDSNNLWLEMVGCLQQHLRNQFAQKKLCIEANPTSNLIIGGFSHYHDLPYKTLVNNRLALSINTDDPGLFLSSLPGEYAAMYQALSYDKTMSHREILNWLNDRKFDAEQSSFLGNHVPVSLRQIKGVC